MLAALVNTPFIEQSFGPAGPAASARGRWRHFLILLSFIWIVVAPNLAAGIYLWTRAADQYASHLAFSVRTENSSSAIELLGGITELSGAGAADADILFAYLGSQELVAQVDAEVDLRRIWSRVPHGQDPVFAFDPRGTIEDLQEHWARQIRIVHDSRTGLIDLRVLAFDPQDAHAIAQAVLAECTDMINSLSKAAQQDAIRFTQEELLSAEARVRNARQALTEFRNRTQIVDPSIDTQNQMGLLVTLQQQLADALIEADLLQDTTRDNDPRIRQANRRIEVIRARITSERQNLGMGEGGDSSEVFATLVGQYEGLIVNREFAESVYTGALAAHDRALAEVRRQSRYLAAHVKPTRAEQAEYPRRMWILVLVALFGFFAWAILVLVYYSLRDRR